MKIESIAKYGLVLLTSLVISGCLWDPLDGQVSTGSWVPLHFNIFWPFGAQQIQLECNGSNGWQMFATGKTETTISVAAAKNPLYNLQLDAVVPVDCWKVAPTGAPALYTAQVRGMLGINQLLTFNSQSRNCVLHGDATHVFNDDPSKPDYIDRASKCSSGNTLTLYANQHDPYRVQANSWNYVYQQQYAGNNVDDRWTGGDVATSLDLPFCSDCPAPDKYRKLWIFGDSYTTQITVQNTRPTIGLGNLRLGNTMAITSHGDSNTALTVAKPMFDWGAQPLNDTSALNPASYNSWMPLLMNTNALTDLHPLRIGTKGYKNSGFNNQGSIAQVYRSPWAGSWLNETRNNELVPVYEYYSATGTFNEYRTTKIPNGSFSLNYERIAFWVFKSQQPGTIPLYRYFTNDFSDELLSISPNVAGSYGYQGQVLLGYVYPASSSAPAGTYPLWQYLKSYSSTDLHHKYTTRKNDDGYPAAMWGSRGIVIGNDLVHLFAPVLFSGNTSAWDWETLEKGVVSIIKGVNRPYSQWGKVVKGNWTATIPAQFSLEPSNATTRWGVFTIKDLNYDTNKFVYVYGVRNNRDEQNDPNHTNDVVMARVPCTTAEDFVNFNNWRYLHKDENGNDSWVIDQDAATPIASNVIDFSIVRNPLKNDYILVHGGTRLAPNVSFSRGASLTGPFTPIASFDLSTYANEAGTSQNYIYYAQTTHNGLSAGGNNNGLLISYIRAIPPAFTNIISSDTIANPSVYVPRFVNLPWSTIDP